MRPNQEFFNLLNNVNYGNYLVLNSNYHLQSSQSKYEYNLITSNNMIENDTGSFESYTSIAGSPIALNISIPDTTPVNSNYMVFNTDSSSNNDWTIFVVKQNPASLTNYTSLSNMLITTSQTGLGNIRGISQLDQASRWQVTYRQQVSPTIIDACQTFDIKVSGGAQYEPGANGKFIDVFKVINTGSYPSVYLTRNGRGSSGGKYHVAGSYITGGGGTTFGGSNQIIPARCYRVTGKTAYLRLYETIIFRRALSQVEIDGVETYLKNRWSISY